MPTYAHATVIGHLSADPELKTNASGQPYVQVRAWTKDKDWRDKDGDPLFTTWRGIISGPQAEWLARDGRKQSLVMLSGTVRVDLYQPAGSEPRASIEFTRLEECRILDRPRKGAGQEESRPAGIAESRPTHRQAAPSAPPADDDSETPF